MASPFRLARGISSRRCAPVGRFRDRAGTTAEAIGRELTPALFAGAEAIQIEAQLSITNGAVSGKGHVPSLPGEPPNQDTGVLGNNIEASLVDAKHARVSSSARYAAALEFGTSKMADRPYMRPAAAKARPEVEKLIAGAVRRGLRKHFGR